MISVGLCNQNSKALNDTTWVFNTFLASTTTKTTNLYTSLPNNTLISQTTPFQIPAPGKSFYGGYFTLFFLSNDTDFAYYQLDFIFMIRNNSFISQTNCSTNSTPNIIRFYNTSDFAINCEQGCTSLSNTSLLGYLDGTCLSASPYMGWSMIKNSYRIVGNLSEKDFKIIHEPKNLNFIDWVQLNHYFKDKGGYLFKLNNSLVPRPDSGLYNNPPEVLFPMITTIQMQYSYLELFHIPIMDENDDVIQCN